MLCGSQGEGGWLPRFALVVAGPQDQDSDDSDPDNVPINCTSCGRSFLDDASGVTLCVACRMRTKPSLAAHTSPGATHDPSPPALAAVPRPGVPSLLLHGCSWNRSGNSSGM